VTDGDAPSANVRCACLVSGVARRVRAPSIRSLAYGSRDRKKVSEVAPALYSIASEIVVSAKTKQRLSGDE